jgi:GNAT superfamily N-acetyltransferase
MTAATIRPVRAGDEAEVKRMRSLLWPDCPDDDHDREIAAYVAGTARSPAGPSRMWVAARDRGGLAGFVEAGLRSYAEGCDEAPVPCVEAWFVDDDQRRRGTGRALITTVEDWACGLGYDELASDTGIDNEGSLRAHEALGFAEVERTIHLRKPLGVPQRPAVRQGQLAGDVPAALSAELVTVLADGSARVERIVSRGHASPPGAWYDQDEHEWVAVIAGAARLEIADGDAIRTVALGPGDWIDLPRRCRHRVAWTTPDADTIWLAVFRS